MANNRIYSLKTRADFLSTRRNGIKIRTNELFVLYIIENKIKRLRVGITASRRIGSAVVRNRLKRWSKESLRSLQVSLDGFDINIIFTDSQAEKIRQMVRKNDFQQFRQSLENAIKRKFGGKSNI